MAPTPRPNSELLDLPVHVACNYVRNYYHIKLNLILLGLVLKIKALPYSARYNHDACERWVRAAPSPAKTAGIGIRKEAGTRGGRHIALSGGSVIFIIVIFLNEWFELIVDIPFLQVP